MAKKYDKKDKGKRKENNNNSNNKFNTSEEDNLENTEEYTEYQVDTLEDYFFATKDLFVEFRNFTVMTNKTLTVTLNSLRELIPMIMTGKIDYSRVSKILNEVNQTLQKYLLEQERLIAKTTSLSRELKDKNKVQKMIDEYFSRLSLSFVPYEYERTQDREKDINILPSAIFKELNEEKIKEIMEKFGIDNSNKNNEEK